MKKCYFILTLTAFFGLFNTSFAAISTTSTAAIIQTTVSKSTIVQPTKRSLKPVSIAEIEAKTGQKLTWMQKLAVKSLAKEGRKGSFGIGFALGFFAGAVGVVLAYVVFEEDKETRKGAWWGFGASVLLSLILILTFSAALRVR